VQTIVHSFLENIPNVFLIEPLDYLDFVNLMSKTYLILTDSGGVQEEGPFFGIPILVLRELTERPEAIEFGTVKLVGLNEISIFSAADILLRDNKEYLKMAMAINPYGDGLAAGRTVKVIKNYFGISRITINEFDPKSQKENSAQMIIFEN
jgi:UDP-N-acetylglucosamine 2-epimerase (non-hydrolysing)